MFHDEGTSYNQSGQWGGIVLQGRAGHADCAAGEAICNAMDVEGTDPDQIQRVSTLGYMGGDNDDDSSGVLSHVVIASAGRNGDTYYDSSLDIDYETRLAGLLLQSVGRGTTIEHVQINHAGWRSEAAVEVSGGSVGIKQLVISHHERDSILVALGVSG